MAVEEGHLSGYNAGRVRKDGSVGERDWHALDHVLRDMEACASTTGLVRRLLHAARAFTSADAVFAISAEVDGPFEALADRPLPRGFCRRFVRRQGGPAKSGRMHYRVRTRGQRRPRPAEPVGNPVARRGQLHAHARRP